MNALDPAGEGNKPSPNPPEDTWSEKVKTVGGLVAVGIGVFAVATIAIVAMSTDTSSAATIASSAGGIIATIVGAYFGVKVGTDQSKTAIESQKAEGAKAQVYAAHLPPEQASSVLDMAEKAARSVIDR